MKKSTHFRVRVFWLLPSMEKYLIGLLMISIIFIGFTLDGCTKTINIRYFPIQKESHDIFPLGAIEGTLAVENGSLRVARNDATGITTLPIWPSGYSYRVKNGKVEVLDDEGVIVARTSDRVSIGGGEAEASSLDQSIAQPLPGDCPGPYWLVGGVIKDYTLELEKARKKLGLPEPQTTNTGE
jgi:hypothetical protein